VYASLYVPEFPDANERESIANIERYLRLKDEGWYGANNYHVLVVLEAGEPIAGSISDYLAEADTGVVEFLVVGAARRRARLGRRLLDATERTLAADAERHGRMLEAIVAELNDPFKSGGDDSLDPFVRLRVWDAWGYAKLDFPYVQAALSPAQRPVRHLLLAMKTRSGAGAAVECGRVRRIVHEYMRWAMRVEEPARAPEFIDMARDLDQRVRVPLVPLMTYIGHDPAHPLSIREIARVADLDLDATLAVYAAAFPPGPTSVTPASFRASLASRRHVEQPHADHLWAIRPSPAAPVSGMASFYTLPGAGFGGYLAFAAGLRGTGRLPAMLARIETQMVCDGKHARGWYVECALDGVVAAIFERHGFREVAVRYRQPLLNGSASSSEGIPQRLLYKDFGAVYEAPRIGVTEFLDSIARIYATAYRIERPRAHPLYDALAAEVERAGSFTIPFR
jgi:hypothetical protein